jgi:hypothetical protein
LYFYYAHLANKKDLEDAEGVHAVANAHLLKIVPIAEIVHTDKQKEEIVHHANIEIKK